MHRSVLPCQAPCAPPGESSAGAGTLTLYRCPPLTAWLTEAACTANKRRVEKAAKLTPVERRLARAHKLVLWLACCRTCPGVRALRERRETPVPRTYPLS